MAAFFGFVGSVQDSAALDVRAVTRLLVRRGESVRTVEDRDADGRHSTVLLESMPIGADRSRDEKPGLNLLLPILLFSGPRRATMEKTLAGVRDVDAFVMRELDVGSLRGGFAFAIWGRTHRTLALGCDAAGLLPIYICGSDKWFVFSTSLSAMLACDLVRRRLSREAVARYLRYGACSEDCLIDGVRRLRPGSFVIVRPFSSSTGRLANTVPRGEYLLNELRETIASQVPKGEPVALLSDGSDFCGDLLNVVRQAGAGSIVRLSLSGKETTPTGVTIHPIDPSAYEPERVLDGVLSSWDEPMSDGIGEWLAAAEARRIGARMLVSDVVPEEPGPVRLLRARPATEPRSDVIFGERDVARLIRLSKARELTSKLDPPIPRHRLAVSSLSQMASAHSVGCCAPLLDGAPSGSSGARLRRTGAETEFDARTTRSWLLDHGAELCLDALQALAESGVMDGDALRTFWSRFRFDVDPSTTTRLRTLVSLGSWVRRNEIAGFSDA